VDRKSCRAFSLPLRQEECTPPPCPWMTGREIPKIVESRCRFSGRCGKVVATLCGTCALAVFVLYGDLPGSIRRGAKDGNRAREREREREGEGGGTLEPAYLASLSVLSRVWYLLLLVLHIYWFCTSIGTFFIDSLLSHVPLNRKNSDIEN